MLQRFSGAAVRRVVDHSGTFVPEHAHDWPLLSIYVLGGYLNGTELGETTIAGPSAVFYRPGASHRNQVLNRGFEQIEVEFDPAWLGDSLPDARVVRWIGGRAGAEARALARGCQAGLSEDRLRAAMLRLFAAAAVEGEPVPAPWVGEVAKRLNDDPHLSVGALAAKEQLHPSWLGDAYRRATGEGVQETAARLRVEQAAKLLRETELPAAIVAADAGFCDQSHMIRTFRRVLGRTPTAVREDRGLFRRG